MVQVSVTERGTYKRCRRRWDLGSENRQALMPIGAGAPALELGSLVHKALAEWILHPQAQLDQIFAHFANERMEEIEQLVSERFNRAVTDEDTASIVDTFETGLFMMTKYQEHHKQPIPKNMTFASAEQGLIVAVPGTEHECPNCTNAICGACGGVVRPDCWVCRERIRFPCATCNGSGQVMHYLTGTLDGLLQNKDGDLFILEHKTYSRHPDIHALHSNDQFTAYCWMVRQLGLGKVAGVAYDGMWKRKAIPKGKKLSDMFLRLPIRKTDTELDEFGIMLAGELNEMGRPDLPIYTNRRWEGCGDCGFENLCTAMSKGDDVEEILELKYTKRTDNKIRGVRDEELVH